MVWVSFYPSTEIYSTDETFLSKIVHDTIKQKIRPKWVGEKKYEKIKISISKNVLASVFAPRRPSRELRTAFCMPSLEKLIRSPPSTVSSSTTSTNPISKI